MRKEYKNAMTNKRPDYEVPWIERPWKLRVVSKDLLSHPARQILKERWLPHRTRVQFSIKIFLKRILRITKLCCWYWYLTSWKWKMQLIIYNFRCFDIKQIFNLNSWQWGNGKGMGKMKQNIQSFCLNSENWINLVKL